jgi:hypothetical protein
MGKLAWVATSGAQPWTSSASSSAPLWYPAVSESPRKTVVVKFPALLACAVVVEVELEELPPEEQLASPSASAQELPIRDPFNAARRTPISFFDRNGELSFIFMAKLSSA